MTADWVRKEQKRIEVEQDSQDTKCQRPIGLQTSFDRVHIGDTKTEQCHIAKSQKQDRQQDQVNNADSAIIFLINY